MTHSILDNQINEELFTNLQEKLNRLTSPDENVFSSMKWTFCSDSILTTAKLTIDFTPIQTLALSNPAWSAKIGIDIVLVTKILWLETSADVKGTNTLKITYDCLCLLWIFLAQQDAVILDYDNLQKFLDFYVMHSWKGKPIKRLTPKSFQTVGKLATQLNDWHFYLTQNQLNCLVIEELSWHSLEQALRQTITNVGNDGLTYSDWQAGLSLNYLTLDYGRYYVEYCTEYFTQNIAIATALQKTHEERWELIGKLGWKNSDTSNKGVVYRLMTGVSPEEIAASITISLEKLKTLQKMVERRFRKHLRPLKRREQLLQDSVIAKIAERLNLTPQQHKLDRLKFIITELELGCSQSVVKRLLNESFGDIDVRDLNLVIRSVRRSLPPLVLELPTPEYFRKLGVLNGERGHNFCFRKFVARVRNAGITTLVALCGWRRSEFSFPMSAINIKYNTDTLDQYAYPLRITIKWHIFKTNGNTQDEREILYSAYNIVRSLAALHNPKKNEPALYPLRDSNCSILNSAPQVSAAVKSLWSHFVINYGPFKQIDNLEVLQTLIQKRDNEEPLTLLQMKKIDELTHRCNEENWPALIRDRNLVETRRRAREELPKVQFYLQSPSTKERRNYLLKYKKGVLKRDWTLLLDEHLSDKTKHSINNDDDDDVCKTTAFVKQVTNELMNGCLYPTPHAFRHMWAEAVYRRFDGDVGWMIRSQFKHISHNMWLSYIRDKDNRRTHDTVKVNVVSSILKEWLSNQGSGYAGKFHHYLRLIFAKTKVMPMEKVYTYFDKYIKHEIDDIKANPWGYCILRRRNKSLAKCTVNGEPQRQNATPALCLGCINNLTKSSNIDYMLFNIGQQMSLLDAPKVPAQFKQESYKAVKNTLKHIKQLDPSHQIISQLELAITTYEGGN